MKPDEACPLCLELFEPRPGRNEEGAQTDRRPVESQKAHCRHHICVDCLHLNFAQSSRLTMDCPKCRQQGAFHKGRISASPTFCLLLQVPNWSELQDFGDDPARPQEAGAPELPRGNRTSRRPPRRFQDEQGASIVEPNRQRRRVSSPPESALALQGTVNDEASDDSVEPVTSYVASRRHVACIPDQDDRSYSGESLEQVPSNVVNMTQINLAANSSSEPLFTKENFESNRLFHVNPFLKKINHQDCNRGFAAFIATSSICFWYPPTTRRYAALQTESLNYREILQRLQEEPGHSKSRITEVHMWFTKFRVGDFVFMRHEYGKCPFLPAKLQDDNGRYIGPVYALGVITEGPFQEGSEELVKDLKNHVHALDEKVQNELEQKEASFCRVKFLRMGYKRDLEDTTNSYILSICQATIKNICQPGKSWKLDTTPKRVREDLWKNATMPISADDFK